MIRNMLTMNILKARFATKIQTERGFGQIAIFLALTFWIIATTKIKIALLFLRTFFMLLTRLARVIFSTKYIDIIKGTMFVF